jgi:hypothetical protein
MILKIIALGPGFRPPEDPAVDPELAVLPPSAPSIRNSASRLSLSVTLGLTIAASRRIRQLNIPAGRAIRPENDGVRIAARAHRAPP